MPRATVLCLLAAACAVGCDNVVRVFNPGGGPGSGQGTRVQAMVAGGTALNARPKVSAAFPSGGGWPPSTPVVVVFSESINRDTVAPPSAAPGIPGGGQGEEEPATPGIVLRNAQTQAAVAVTYDFLLGDTVVLIRPLGPLTPGAGATGAAYQVVVDPSVRDVDGVSVGGSEPEVVAEFTPDADPQDPDGRILATLPADNARSWPREAPIFAVFTKPPVEGTVTETSFSVRTAAGVPVNGKVWFPIAAAGLTDTRVVRFDSTSLLAGEADHEIVVNSSIQFPGGGVLDFGNRTPFARFHTLAFSAVQDIGVADAQPPFTNKVNRANIEALVLEATLDDSAAAGDTVTARVYGLDPETTGVPDDVNFVERSVQLAVGGAQAVRIDFSGALGSAAAPRFSDGALTLAAQSIRGTARAGFTTSSTSDPPVQDLVPPELIGAGTALPAQPLDLLVDQETAVFHGRASEPLGAATLTVGSDSAALFAAAADGRFAMTPVELGLATAPLAYTLSITDAAGNLAPMAFSGRIVPRGVVSGSVAGGALVVEVYDETTLAPVANAAVVVEPGMPAKPAVDQRVLASAADGRAVFSNLTQSRYSVTVAAAGYHLRSLLDTGAGFVSLGLRPQTAATASLRGTAAFMPAAGATALVGSNLIDDPLEEDVQTSPASPTTIPATEVRPGRLQVLNAFGGNFEPTALPTFVFHACQMCGPTGVTPSAPSGPYAAGAVASEVLAMIPISLTTLNLAAPYDLDFSTAAGLNTNDLVGTPTVRMLGSLRGFAGMTLFGVGFAQQSAPGRYAIHATYSLSTALNLTTFHPVLFVSSEARDRSGNVSRHRRLVDIGTGITIPTVSPLGIPEVSPPATPSVGSPAVTYQDRLDIGISGLLGMAEIVATDGAGRSWSLLRQDVDGALGPVTVQLPELGSGVAGLAPGEWDIRAAAHVFFTLSMAEDNLVLEEVRRQQIAWARSTAVRFAVQ